jgi:hypothetical protein
MSDLYVLDKFYLLRENEKMKEQPWADNDNGCINQDTYFNSMYIPTRAWCYLFREQSTIISTHSMKRAFTYSLARADKKFNFATNYNGMVHELYLWFQFIKEWSCIEYKISFHTPESRNIRICFHMNISSTLARVSVNAEYNHYLA